MEIVIKILQLLLSLSILVICHEFGHFLFAKLFKVRVEKFYLFFNPGFSLFKFKKGETEYGIGWLPLGGYVKIAGMIDESMDTDQMKKEPQPWEFRSKPAWQRLCIMCGGVLVNVILAFVIYIFVLFAWGESYLPPENVKYGVVADPVFAEMGVQKGDVIVALDHQKVEDFFSIIPDIQLNNPKTMQVLRNGREISLNIPDSLVPAMIRMSSSKEGQSNLYLYPRWLMDSTFVNGFAEYSAAFDAGIRKGDRIISVNGRYFSYYDEFTDMLDTLKDKRVTAVVQRGADTLTYAFKLGHDGKFGIAFGTSDHMQFMTKKFTFFQSVPAGISKGGRQIVSYLKQLRLLFNPEAKAYKSLGGMMSIGNIFPGVWNWQAFWELTAFISIMLAVINILPIPALDGGHVMFLLYEVISRRKPSLKFMENAQVIGMILILGLFLLANVNDIIRFFG